MRDKSTLSKVSVQNKQMHYSPNLLSTINNSIDNSKLANIEYDSHEKGVTVRDVEPMALVFKDGKRHLVGWCRLRNDYRSFRLDRINCIKLKTEDFTRRQDFNIEEHQDSNASVYSDEITENE